MEEFRQKQIEFQKLCEPVFKTLSQIMMTSIPEIILHPDGKIEFKYNKDVIEFQEKCYDYIRYFRDYIFANPQINADRACIECGMMNGGHMPGCKMIKLD